MTPVEEGRIVATVEHLTEAVTRLTTVVERLDGQQNYWRGALAALLLLSAGMGAVGSAFYQWLHK